MPIVSGTMTYQDLLDMFGSFYQMPAEESMKGDWSNIVAHIL